MSFTPASARLFQKRALAVGHEQATGVHIKITRFMGFEPAVGVVKIKVAVVVEVRKARAPAPAAVMHACVHRYVRERTAIIAIQPVAHDEILNSAGVRYPPDRTHKPVKIAVAIVIAHRRTHPVAVNYHVGIRGVAKSAVAIVCVVSGSNKIGGNYDVGIAIIGDAGKRGTEGVVAPQFRQPTPRNCHRSRLVKCLPGD